MSCFLIKEAVDMSKYARVMVPFLNQNFYYSSENSLTEQNVVMFLIKNDDEISIQKL